MAVRATLRECGGECECLCARTTAREQQGQEQRELMIQSIHEYNIMPDILSLSSSCLIPPRGHHFAKGGIISTREERQL